MVLQYTHLLFTKQLMQNIKKIPSQAHGNSAFTSSGSETTWLLIILLIANNVMGM